VDRTLPLVLFGILGISAGVMALWLPETLFSPMPQTVKEVEDWPEDYRNYCCKKRPDLKQDGTEMKNEQNIETNTML